MSHAMEAERGLRKRKRAKLICLSEICTRPSHVYDIQTGRTKDLGLSLILKREYALRREDRENTQ